MSPSTALIVRPGPPSADAVAAERRNGDVHPIEHQIRECLNRSGYYEVREVTCSFHEGVAIIRGRVSSFFFKQTAQEIVRKVDDVDHIINRIVVR